MLDRCLRREEEAQYIHVKMFVEVCLGYFFQRREFIDPGVIHENVNLE